MSANLPDSPERALLRKAQHSLLADNSTAQCAVAAEIEDYLAQPSAQAGEERERTLAEVAGVLDHAAFLCHTHDEFGKGRERGLLDAVERVHELKSRPAAAGARGGLIPYAIWHDVITLCKSVIDGNPSEQAASELVSAIVRYTAPAALSPEPQEK